MTTRVPTQMLGALAPSGGSDTAALQAALTAGQDVLLAPGTYLAANLTMSTASQRLVALGNVRIVKNANGPILTVSGADCVLEGVGFRGDAVSPTFTGDNVVVTGDNCRLVNCGSRWAAGAAVKATGQALQVIGTCDIYQTATGTGYDIDVGVSGTGFLVGAAQTLQDGTARMQVITHSAAAAAGPGVPITWATGDEVRVTITYSV